MRPHGRAAGEAAQPAHAARPAGDGLAYASSAGKRVVATTVLGSGMALLDSTVVNIALPVIGRQFHATVAGLQWVVTAYLLTLSGLLLLGGALGDRYGRRRVYLIGVVWFALASALCGLAPDAGVLIAARALQGVGGALLTPGSLAILQSAFTPSDRARAIGAWTGLSSIATAVGPFLGGWLIAAVSWRLIFLINLPVAAAVLLLGATVPESRNAGGPKRLDLEGAALVTAGLVLLTYGVIEGGPRGFTSVAVLAALGTGALAVAVFVPVERRRSGALVPMGLFASRRFSAANAVTLLVYAALGGALFLLPVELEQAAHYSPLAAGAALLPVTALMLVLAARFGALSARTGPRPLMGGGPIVAGLGLLLLVRVGPHAAGGGGYVAEVLPAMAVFGLGMSATVAPLTATVLAAAPDRLSGIASAVNNDVARLASLAAVALLPVIAGLEGRAYLDPVRFTRGFHIAVEVCAASCAAGGVLALLAVGGAGGARAAAGRVPSELTAPHGGRRGPATEEG